MLCQIQYFRKLLASSGMAADAAHTFSLFPYVTPQNLPPFYISGRLKTSQPNSEFGKRLPCLGRKKCDIFFPVCFFLLSWDRECLGLSLLSSFFSFFSGQGRKKLFTRPPPSFLEVPTAPTAAISVLLYLQRENGTEIRRIFFNAKTHKCTVFSPNKSKKRTCSETSQFLETSKKHTLAESPSQEPRRKVPTFPFPLPPAPTEKERGRGK